MVTETTVGEHQVTPPSLLTRREPDHVTITPIQQSIDYINAQYFAMCKICGKEPSTSIQLSSIESDYKSLCEKHPNFPFKQYIEYLSESKSWHVKPNFANLPENLSQDDMKIAFDPNSELSLEYNLESLRTYSERKRKFTDAVHSYNPKYIDFAFTNVDKTRIQQEVMEAGLLLVGETHGIVQNCDVIYTMCKSLCIRRLAIEFPRDYQSSIDTFLTSGNLDFGQIEHYPDGRVNAEFYALMKKMRDEGVLDQVICMDKEDFQIPQSDLSRDQSMHDNLLAQRDATKPILAIAGNMHTTPRDTRIDDSDHSLGFLVLQSIPNTPIATIRYQEGHYYNYGIQTVSGTIGETSTNPMWGYTDSGLQIIIPHADIATVPNPNESKAPPA